MSAVFDFVNFGAKRRACNLGASFNQEFLCKTPSGAPKDLTGLTVSFVIYTTKFGEVVSTIVPTVTPLLGKIEVNISSTATALFPAGRLYYYLTTSGGPAATTRLIEGVFEVT